MEARTRSLALALVLSLALTLAGCGSKSEPAPTHAKSAALVKKAATPADSLSPYLVAAVTTAKSGAGLMQLKFELAGRPQVGEPVDVDLVIVPQADNITQISGTVQGDEGLEVVSGDAIPPEDKVTFGTPIHHALRVRAKRDGIFTLSAAMTVESGGQTLAPVYTMPFIAGNGMADTGASPVPAKTPPKPLPTAAK